jgi:Flp pilus assembly protein TadG
VVCAWMRSHSRAGGQAVVELALALPVILLLLFGIARVAVALQRYEVVVHAAREGARVASLSRGDAQPVTDAVAAAKRAAADLTQADVGVAVTVTPAPPWTQGQQISVTVTYPYSISIMGVVVASGTMTSTSTAELQ